VGRSISEGSARQEASQWIVVWPVAAWRLVVQRRGLHRRKRARKGTAGRSRLAEAGRGAAVVGSREALAVDGWREVGQGDMRSPVALAATMGQKAASGVEGHRRRGGQHSSRASRACRR
jgi:hypothetical protein